MSHKLIVITAAFTLIVSCLFVSLTRAQIHSVTVPAKQLEQVNKKIDNQKSVPSNYSARKSVRSRDSTIVKGNSSKLNTDKEDNLSLNEILTLCISFASLVISGITVAVGWKVYQKFLSQKLVENQLQVVLDLIKSIYDNVFHITTVFKHESGGEGYAYSYKNMFQLVNGGSLKPDDPHNYPILLLQSHTFKFKPWTFLSNPILPDRIGKKLHAFHDSIVTIISNPDELKVYMVIGKRKKDYSGPEFALSQFEGGFSGFLEHCAAIDYEIKKWLKDQGLTDLNQHVVSTEYKRWLV